MKLRTFAFPTLGASIFLAGYFMSEQVGGALPQVPSHDYLAELHLHGSISEGRATMWHHSESPGIAGVNYDVLWWTDHIGRSLSQYFPQQVDFENGTLQSENEYGVMRFIRTDRETTESSVEGSSNLFARYTHTNPSTSDWTASGAYYATTSLVHRVSLMTDPEIRLDLRLPSVTAPHDMNVVIRVTLSSRRGNGKNETGAPNIIEYSNLGMNLPALDNGALANTIQIPKFDVRGLGFTSVVLQPLADSEANFYEGADQSIYSIEILAAGRNGEVVTIEFDNFDLSVDPSRCNKNLFVATEDLVHSGVPPYSNLTQHVGMELAGPREQKIGNVSGRDHLVALYRDSIKNSISEVYDFSSPGLLENWPKTGVDLVHNDNGVVILAHMFGPKIPPGEVPQETIDVLAERVVANNAWGADGIEIGYKLRGAPLETFLEVWDQLSSNRVYITGVGVSDHHNVKDWDLRINRMATWIQATSDDSADLADAIQSGHAFFGDPYRFDSATGDFDLRVHGTTVTMGDVFPIKMVEDIRFKADVSGAQPGDVLVWLHNGVVVDRHSMSSSARTAFNQLTVKPGDWVRIEMRTGGEEIYLMSNPIYVVAPGDIIPHHRSW